MILMVMIVMIREHLPEKKSISFGHCPKRGGGTLPEFVEPFPTMDMDMDMDFVDMDKQGLGPKGLSVDSLLLFFFFKSLL